MLDKLRGDKTKKPPTTPGMEADRELAQLILNGDREAMSRLLDRHLSAVYSYLRRRTGPGHDEMIAAVVTATFADALRHMKRYASGAETMPLRARLIRTAGKQLAKQPRSQVERGNESDNLNSLRTAMLKLAPRKQDVLALALFEGLNAEEIAEATGYSQARSMRLLRSGLKQTEKLLVRTTGEEPLIG